MKTALLIFFIWLTGFLISYVIYCRAIRYKGTANVFDYVMAFCSATLSWVFLLILFVCYCSMNAKKWKTAIRSWWNRL